MTSPVTLEGAVMDPTSLKFALLQVTVVQVYHCSAVHKTLKAVHAASSARWMASFVLVAVNHGRSWSRRYLHYALNACLQPMGWGHVQSSMQPPLAAPGRVLLLTAPFFTPHFQNRGAPQPPTCTNTHTGHARNVTIIVMHQN